MTGIKLELAKPEFKDDWYRLWSDYLLFYKTKKTKYIYQTTWDRILSPTHNMFSILAFKDNTAIGMVNFLYHPSFWDAEDYCYLNDLYVDPKTRKTGTGKALIQAVVKHAQTKNTSQIYWTTAQDNTVARVLYDKIATLTPFIKYKI